MKIGYANTNNSNQINFLEKAGCEKIFMDTRIC